MQRVGFIGVGLMGEGMATNILAKGFALTIMGHRNREPVERLLAKGAREAKSPKDLAAASDVVILCVTGTPQVEALMDGPDGLIAGARKGLIIVDTSTADPTSTKALGARLESVGAHLVDAPLGGTPAGAAAGQLTAMVGGTEALFESVKPLLSAYSQRVDHVGPLGAGHTLKLLNNMLAMGYGALYAEALAVGAKAGVTVKVFDQVLRGSRMDCGFYQTFFDNVLNGNRDAHKFAIANAHKDMRYLANLATTLGVPNPVGNAVKNAYAGAEAQGHGQDYVPQIADFVAAQSGVSLKRS